MHKICLLSALALWVTACGGNVAVSDVSESDVNRCPGAEVGYLTIQAKGPDEGDISLGTQDAMFLEIKMDITCGTATLDTLSIHLESETPTQFCAPPCGDEQSQWNFRNPRLTSGSVEVEPPVNFQSANKYSGKPSSEAAFKKPLIISADKDNRFEFRLDVSPSETVPGSLIGKRFRATIGTVGVVPPNGIVIDPSLPISGGYQLITTH